LKLTRYPDKPEDCFGTLEAAGSKDIRLVKKPLVVSHSETPLSQFPAKYAPSNLQELRNRPNQHSRLKNKFRVRSSAYFKPFVLAYLPTSHAAVYAKIVQRQSGQGSPRRISKCAAINAVKDFPETRVRLAREFGSKWDRVAP